jgi:hypothetical protein
MPKIVEVALESIACTNNGFGGNVQISGNTFGSAFQNTLDEQSTDTRVIFPFPAGPISIAEGETKLITMEGVRFSLTLNTPSHEPVHLGAKFLKVVGELNSGLGSNDFVIRFDDPLPFAPSPSERPDNPRRYDLDYATANLGIRLTFAAFVAQVI